MSNYVAFVGAGELEGAGMVDCRLDKDSTLNIELTRNPTGQLVVWVNVNGVCRFRAQTAGHVDLVDNRNKEQTK